MTKILVVDDEEELIIILEDVLERAGFEVISANDGVAALSKLAELNGDVSAIILDRRMPKMDGFQVLTELKESDQYKDIPVIIQTGLSNPDDVVVGIELGAYYYIIKPYKIDVLVAIVRSAIDDRKIFGAAQQTIRDCYGAISLLETGTFRISTLDEARNMASLLANACPEPEKVEIGLLELLVNSIEHGNLGVSFDEKKELMIAGQLTDELKRRLVDRQYTGRSTEIEFTRSEKHICFQITDEGEGFEPEQYLDFDPLRAGFPNGRGIAMANSISFSSIVYNGKGNEVIAKISL